MITAQFLGILAAVCLDPIVILAAIISGFIGKTYGEFILWSFGIGFITSIAELAMFGQQPGAFMPIIAVPLLATIVRLIRAMMRSEPQSKKELPPEDVDYFIKNYTDEKKE